METSMRRRSREVRMRLRKIGPALLVAFATALGTQAAAREGSYDSSPDRLWSQLEDTLFLRTAADGRQYGRGHLDILFWPGTRYLLEGSSHSAAVRVMDRVIKSHGERMIQDPLRRVMLLRELWQLFDWAALGEPPLSEDEQFPVARAELRERLAVIIRRLALTDDQIAALPDNYAMTARTATDPDLPAALFDPAGDWLIVGAETGSPTALTHTSDFR